MKRRLLVLLSTAMLMSLTARADGIISVKSSGSPAENGLYEMLITVSLNPGWYIYSSNPANVGPTPTSFEAIDIDGCELSGRLQDTEVPLRKFDPGFGTEVEYFEGKAVFRQMIKPLREGALTVKGTLVCQTCNGMECILNEYDVSFTAGDRQAAGNGEPASSEIRAGQAGPEAESGSQPLWKFLLVAFAAGLAGVVTPCVFPMIPMTVGFLMGTGGSRKSGILKGIIFGISVILIYTALGLIVAVFESTAATDALGTHWIPNLVFALLFIIFGISFLGAFEITLPGSMADKADRQADKGGYIAAFFAALAMVIVSFSCTGPFVGSILAASVMDGVALKPVLGMAVFGLAFSLPFVICSVFPAFIKKMPKSGSWLNMVKVVFAFIMLAFSMKFLYNVDAYFGLNIITRTGFISVWAALSLVLGLYLLGIFRTKHDGQSEGAGWIRICLSVACLSFAFYLASGLSGAPLKSVSGLIPPEDSPVSAMQPAPHGPTQATGSGYASIESFSTLEEAVLAAREQSKPIFISFKSHTCSVCKMMESTVLSNAEILNRIESGFIIANLYVDDKRPDAEFRTLGRRFRDYEMRQFGSASQPLYAIIDAEGNTLSGPVGSCSEEEFMAFLNP